MVPRLQCVNVARDSKYVQSCLRTFSTSQRACDGNQNESAALLGSLFQSPNSNSSPSESPIRLPQRSISRNVLRTDRPGSDGGRSIAGPSRLIQQTLDRQRTQTGRRPGNMSPTVADVEKTKMANELSRQISRRWKQGDIYAPHDLSATESQKWKKNSPPEYDVFDVLGMNPIDEYKNFSILSEYMSPMGRIKHSNETGLRSVNQRRISKAIRRSIGMGIMPSVHRHPEILQKEAQRQHDQQIRSRMAGL